MKPDRVLLAVFAHPDDETFRAGGTLALLAKQGVRVQVLTATRGGAGSCGDPPMCSPEALPAVREGELRCAIQSLGLPEPIVLGYQDETLSAVTPEEIVLDILDVIRKVQPQIMISFGADGLSGHPDHVAIGRDALRAFREAKSVCAFYTLTVPQSIASELHMNQIRAVSDDLITLAVDVSAVWKAKMASIRCHRTQMGVSPILQADRKSQRLFLAKEHFCLAESRRDPDCESVDLMKWLAL